jgi:lactate permease
MHLAFSILPIALLVALMTLPVARLRMPWPAHIALPVVALLVYGMQLFFLAAYASGVNPPVDAHTSRNSPPVTTIVHAAAIDGLLSALTPLAIVLGAVLLFKTMEKSGSMGVITSGLRSLTPDPVAQLVLVGWSFSFLIEGLSGFGTPAALAAPILVGLGGGRFPAMRIAAMCLIMNSVPVSFGAVGMPTWFGLGGIGLSSKDIGEIGWRTALIHTAAAPVIALLALRVVVPWRDVRARAGFVLLSVASSVVPFLVASRFSVEFPSIVGGVSGLIGVAVLARWRIGLPREAYLETAEPQAAGAIGRMPGVSWVRAAMPLLATVLLLAVTRIDAFGIKGLLTSSTGAASVSLGGLGEAWISPALVVGLRDILGTGTEWKMPLLYVPFILPFVVVALASIPWLRMSKAAVRAAWSETAQRLLRPAVALAGALVLVKMMMVGGLSGETAPAMVMGRAMADAAGSSWPYFASLLGALGSFFSGSNTVSNLMFGPIQLAVAGGLGEGGLDRVTILALQSVGGAMGNMVCIHNIVAVAAVLGLSEENATKGEGGGGGVASVLGLMVGPLLVYAIIAAAMAGVLSIVYS